MDPKEYIVPGEQEVQQPAPAAETCEDPVPQAEPVPAVEAVPAETEEAMPAPVMEAVPVQPETPVQPIQAEAPAQPEVPVQPAPTAPAQPYQAAAPRRPSPYANSPYARSPYANPSYAQPQAYAPAKPAQAPAAGKRKTWKKVLCAVLALVVLAGCCAATGILVSGTWEARFSDLQKQYDDKLTELEGKLGSGGSTIVISGETPANGFTPAQVYAMCVDGVVIINAKVTYTEYGQTSTGVSTGSGFIISEDGYVVTNYHVVDGGSTITVGTNDGIEHPAELIGYDDVNDVALLKIRATGLPYLPIGNSDELIVGDQVAAVGNPLGELTSTLTVGYISAKERDVNTDGFAVNMLQTDAAINSGNSGGPLLNMKGEVIGITTAKYSGTSSSGATIEGVGFAIPINDVVDLLNDLMTYGYVNSGYLGVSVSDVDPAIAAYSGIPRGARIEQVVSGYAAERAGLKLADIIIGVGDYQVRTVSELTRVLRKFAPGDTTTITVYRGGRELVLTITLDEKPDTQSSGQSGEQEPTETDWDYWYEYMKPFFDESKGQSYDEWFEQFKEHFGK